jgi:anthranilate/para-aminobenzoate synthase component II
MDNLADMTGKILLIDNYDSFTWNLYHYLGELGANAGRAQ